jgi:hypothetical protein
MCSTAVLISACGGGGDLIEQPIVTNPIASNTQALVSNTQAMVPGVYKLTFSAFSTARLVAPISGIDVAVRFPAGLSVSMVTDGTAQITSTSVTPGSAIQATSLAFGVYSASTRTAYLSMATTQETFRGGQFLNLLFTVAPGTSVTPNDIYNLNAPYQSYKVVGLDTSAHSTVILTDSVKTTLGIEN